MTRHVLALEQATTATRALVLDDSARVIGRAERPLDAFYPDDGWVEQDPERIWSDVLATCREAIDAAGISPGSIEALGIANQRETALLWDRRTGEVLYNAIGWQDRRGAALCSRLRAEGVEETVRLHTGLQLDPLFSAGKIDWLLNANPGWRRRAEAGELAFGTVDSFLIYRLTNGAVHATDATNASRTMLFDIHRNRWDEELLRAMRIPLALLPQVQDTVGHFGTVDRRHLGVELPILAVAGDRQAAAIGHGCVRAGMAHASCSTGAFMLLNTGLRPVLSQTRLVSTVAWRLNGHCTYALEGAVFAAGSAIDWLVDTLKVVNDASETERYARVHPDTDGVYVVPAFTGLGAPWWDAEARGGILGLTRGAGVPQIVRATLESVAYQIRDLVEAMNADLDRLRGPRLDRLRVDGSVEPGDWMMQFMADMLDIAVERPAIATSIAARGIGLLAGLGAGHHPDIGRLGRFWVSEDTFEPMMDAHQRERLYAGWRRAVRRVLEDDGHPAAQLPPPFV